MAGDDGDDRRASLPVQLTVTLPAGAVLVPSWVAVVFLACFVFASLALLLTWDANRTLAREVRALQLHVQDVENVEIRAGNAHRTDFAPWTGSERIPPTKGEK